MIFFWAGGEITGKGGAGGAGRAEMKNRGETK